MSTKSEVLQILVFSTVFYHSLAQRVAIPRLNTPPHLRIVGGEVDYSTTHHASIVYIVSYSFDTSCTGVIVGRRHVLTASHCLLMNNAKNSTSNQQGLTIYYDCQDGIMTTCKSTQVEGYFKHPCNENPACGCREYGMGFHDDLAVLRMVPGTDFGQDAIMLVDGVHGDVPHHYKTGGINATVVGFGVGASMSLSGVSLPATRLMKVFLPIATDATCLSSNPYMAASRGLNFSNVMCTGGQAGRSSCHGDSGGPVMVKKGEATWVVGITSHASQLPLGHGTRCDVRGRYGVSVRTAAYGEWIRAIMQGYQWVCDTCPCFSGQSSSSKNHQMYVNEIILWSDSSSPHLAPTILLVLVILTAIAAIINW
jgi:secreted trypsin-like serine protease